MRRCAIHGNEMNCGQHVIGPCSGVLHGTECDEAGLASPEVDHAHDPNEAHERLGAFAEVVDDAGAAANAPAPSYAEAAAQLRANGQTDENIRIMLHAPGSPYFEELRSMTSREDAHAELLKRGYDDAAAHTLLNIIEQG